MADQKEKLLLGIDIGTTDAKCTFYTPQGVPVASCCQEYSMIHPRPGWAEEDPAQWWDAVVGNIRNCIEKQHVDCARVAAVGVSCTNTFLPVDRDGNALHHAILQLDQRTRDEVEWVREHIGEQRIFQVTGNRIARGTFSLPTIRWFIEHRPDVMEKTYKFLVPSGYIICRLTGEFTISESRMGFTLLGNIHTGRWDESIARDIGLDPAKLPRPCKAYEIAGYVNARAARQTGLQEHTPVVAGAMDTVAAAVGAGAVHANDVFLAVGTCGRLCYSGVSEHFDKRLMNCRNAFDGQWLSIEATNASGASLRWFRDVFGKAVEEEARQGGKSVYAVLDELAEKAAPGSRGLLYFPYLSGERCPIWNPDARGIFFGLSFSTDYGDFARAVMEGVAFSICQGLEIVVKKDCRPEFITLGGGVANSKIWCQIFADVLNYPIKKLIINETETLGDAILAGFGVGLIDDPGSVAAELMQDAELYDPIPENAAVYRQYFEAYKNIYQSVKPHFSEIREIQERFE